MDLESQAEVASVSSLEGRGADSSGRPSSGPSAFVTQEVAAACRGVCWLNMLCSHRYVTLLRCFLMYFFNKHHRNKKTLGCVCFVWLVVVVFEMF